MAPMVIMIVCKKAQKFKRAVLSPALPSPQSPPN